MKALKCLAAVLVVMLAACSEKGDEFVGKWQNTKKEDDKIEIVRNGDSFLLQAKEKPIPATLNGEILTVKGFFNIDIDHVKATDTLAAAGQEYKRIK